MQLLMPLKARSTNQRLVKVFTISAAYLVA